MNDESEGGSSIPASSFARAAAALSLESRSPNEFPDSDSSISDSSSHDNMNTEDDSDEDEYSHEDLSDGGQMDGPVINEEQTKPVSVESELSCDRNSDSAIHLSGVKMQQFHQLDAVELSPGANRTLEGDNIIDTPTATEPSPTLCELTLEASNKTKMNGLFESDSTTENHGRDRERSTTKERSDSKGDMPTAGYLEEDVYNLCSTYSHSPASFADSHSFMTSPVPLSKTVQNPKSASTEQSSLLSRGLSLFGRKAASSRVSLNNNDDASSVISDLSQDIRSIKSSTTLRTTSSTNQRLRDDTRLEKHLEESGLVLVKRLIEFLSACPPAPDEEMKFNGASSVESTKHRKPRGLTLPASSIGWISSQIMKYNDDSNDLTRNNPEEDVFDCYQVPKQQLDCLQTLLRRVTSLRLTQDKWPPPLAPMISEAADTVKRKFSSIPETGTVSSRILSKFTDQTSVADTNSLEEDSVSTATAKEIVTTPFQRYFHELQHNPNIDMRMFPNATKVVVDGIPPNWISHLDTLKSLDMFQMEKGCILDINQLFFPSDSGIFASGGDSSVFMYKSLTKLRLSNCAISEAAGLRGRRRHKSSPAQSQVLQSKADNSLTKKIPTLSRFPILESLNLSHNELFRTKTALAGLSSLPLLSSINLSYNRLSNMKEIFMHIGNVKELILSGNEISSVQGLDRLFSLERLSLDENKIEHLADISRLAKLPFLMNLDIKGNPLEIADPESCRIEVFNLFREVRCKSMSKTATYRDMQQLLPVLDNVLATKDELVAIKSLTFRQAVSLDTANNSGITETTEMKVDILDQHNTRRHVTKMCTPRTVHCRTTVSLSDKTTVLDYGLIPEHSINAQYKIDDVITSIRPNIELSDNSTSHNMSYYRSGTQSSFSLKIDPDGSGVFDTEFPFNLPASILDQAHEGIWNPIPLYQTLPDFEPQEDGDVLSTIENTDLVVEQRILSPRSSDQDLLSVDGSNVATNDENADEKPTNSMFGGIWEQAYRENIAGGAAALNVNSTTTNETSSKEIDYDAEELNAVYDGPSDYRSILVSNDLDLYFDSFVFPRASDDDSQDETLQNDHPIPPRIQLFKFDRKSLDAVSSTQEDVSERYVGVWKEDVLACGSFARSRVQPISMLKRGFHGENIARSGKDVLVSESRKILVCITDSALYLIVDDDVAPKQKKSKAVKRLFPSRIPKGATFDNAFWPHALVRHSLDCLVGITIGFQFQRLILRFSVSNANGMTIEYTYVLLTSNKLHTISLLQKLQSQISDSQLRSPEKEPILIENDDKAFLDALGARTDEVVLHYQILRQVWKRGDREAARRSFVLTDSTIYLLDETYDGDGSNPDQNVRRLGEILLASIDSATLNRVTEVRAANEDPRLITLVIQPLNKLKRAHRWRLLCNDGEGAERLIDDVRKAIGSSVAKS